MIKQLPLNFSMEKYGLKVRLANEDDTEFILSLRTDKELAKFIHQTDYDVQKHLDWFKRYRLREAEGRDYYFIYYKDDKPIGTNRIYNIFEYYGTIGSWLCSPDNEIEVSMATHFFLHDIIFEEIGLDFTVFDVRKGNKHVWKLHQQTGAKKIGESEIDYYFVTTKTEYQKRRNNLLEILNLK